PAAAPAPKPPPAPPKAAAPLAAAEPSEAELQALLDAWLAGKAAVLAGRESAIPLASMARGNQVERVQEERRSDAAEGQTQRISTTIRSLSIEDRSPRRIAVLVTLDYSDQRLDGGGQPVGQPTTLKLRNRYVFARDNDRWLLASFQPAD
ncbi:ARC6/PARC6 family protein, partial [Synechococcus sp. GFB01]|uniref:ARC6/PARC6 family protein n=1 Tax=Synechococcus sp. GFB01 TaxID=1662190 RepID=UPI00064F3DC9